MVDVEYPAPSGPMPAAPVEEVEDKPEVEAAPVEEERRTMTEDERYLFDFGEVIRTRPMRISLGGVTKTLNEWAEDPACEPSMESLRSRIEAGWLPRDAIRMPVGSRKPRRDDHGKFEGEDPSPVEADLDELARVRAALLAHSFDPSTPAATIETILEGAAGLDDQLRDARADRFETHKSLTGWRQWACQVSGVSDEEPDEALQSPIADELGRKSLALHKWRAWGRDRSTLDGAEGDDSHRGAFDLELEFLAGVRNVLSSYTAPTDVTPAMTLARLILDLEAWRRWGREDFKTPNAANDTTLRAGILAAADRLSLAAIKWGAWARNLIGNPDDVTDDDVRVAITDEVNEARQDFADMAVAGLADPESGVLAMPDVIPDASHETGIPPLRVLRPPPLPAVGSSLESIVARFPVGAGAWLELRSNTSTLTQDQYRTASEIFALCLEVPS